MGSVLCGELQAFRLAGAEAFDRVHALREGKRQVNLDLVGYMY